MVLEARLPLDHLSRRDLGRRSSFFGGLCHRLDTAFSPGSPSGVFYLTFPSSIYDKTIRLDILTGGLQHFGLVYLDLI